MLIYFFAIPNVPSTVEKAHISKVLTMRKVFPGDLGLFDG